MDKKRVTITEVAAAARVSKATVDRVLNGREGVKERTWHRVMAAAVDVGYLTAAEAGLTTVAESQDTAPGGNVRSGEGPRPGEREEAAPIVLDFVLPGGSNTFISMLAADIGHAVKDQPATTARVRSIRGFDPDSLAEALVALAGNSGGVGVIGVDHPSVREAIRTLVRAGTPVLTLVSDISNVSTVGYVGIDNRSAGRLAGHLLGRFVGQRAGSVALFAGALAYRGHEEREMGFRHVLQERFPSLRIAVHREVQDDPDRAHDEARSVLAGVPDLVGLYNIGAGNRGIGQALSESGRAGEVVFIGHDLSEHTRRLLLSGVMDVAIDQNPATQARLAVARLAAAARGLALPPLDPLPVLPVFSENIPADFGR